MARKLLKTPPSEAAVSTQPPRFRWYFSYRFVDAFVDELLRSAPAPSTRAAQQAGFFERITLSARAFTLEHRLNGFQRARMGQRITEQLAALGYSRQRIESLLLTIL